MSNKLIRLLGCLQCENKEEALTAGGLLFLSLWVKSSYRTTPKLHTSEATENLLSVRDSGAYLQ